MQVVPIPIAFEVLAHYVPGMLAHDGTFPALSGVPFVEHDQWGRGWVCLVDHAHDGVTYRVGPFHPYAREISDPNLFGTLVDELRQRARAPWN